MSQQAPQPVQPQPRKNGMREKFVGTVSYNCRKGEHRKCTKNSCPCACGHPE